MAKQYHIQLDEGGCAPYVLLPGDPGRVEAIAAVWDSAEKVAQNREYVSYKGVYKGMPISCTSTGIGGASTAIAMEELRRAGARFFCAWDPAALSKAGQGRRPWSLRQRRALGRHFAHLRAAGIPACAELNRPAGRIIQAANEMGVGAPCGLHPLARRVVCAPS